MIIAESLGKLSSANENREDILTSNVFSFFKYADRRIFLLPYLKTLGFDVNFQDAEAAQFIFWPSYADGTEPDVIIIAGDYYILFEAKYHSTFGAETLTSKCQLVRECDGGRLEAKNLGKQFKLIAVTADYYFNPEMFFTIPEEYHRYIQWINWQKIAVLIFQSLEQNPKLSGGIRLFAEDLYGLLLKKNLRNYDGINILGTSRKITYSPESIFYNSSTSVYRGDFLGFLPAFKDNPQITGVPSHLFLADSTTNRRDFTGFLPTLGNALLAFSPPAHLLYLPRNNE